MRRAGRRCDRRRRRTGCRTSFTATRRGATWGSHRHVIGCCRIRCGACNLGVFADGYHGQRCIHKCAYIKLHHDGVEMLLHEVIRDGVGLAYRQQHVLLASEQTIPDLLVYLDNRAFLLDVTR